MKFYKRIASRVKFLLNIVIQYRRGHLEFIDQFGKKAMYNEECLFKRIRKKEFYTSSIAVNGLIDKEIHTYNCYNSLNHKKKKVVITYGKKNRNQNIINNTRQLQFGFVVTMHDCFPEEQEWWDIEVKHYTKVFDLKISFFKDNPPEGVEILGYQFNKNGKIKKDRTGNPVLKALPVDPLIMQKYERIILKVKLLHLQKGDRFRVCWNWKIQ